MRSSAALVAAAGLLVGRVAANPARVEARASATASSVPQVTVRGNAFWAGDDRFYIRGVDYQPGGSSDVADPIADSNGCERDVAEFIKLGVNTVRVYTVDNSANHDDCMNLLASKGIYLALDVNSPKYSLNRDDPSSSYNDVYLQNVFATIDAFQGYSNTLLFFSGNEVVNDDPTTAAAPYVKAVTRDMRQYINNRGYRAIPVGYSAADVSSNRFEMAEFMNCGSDDERSDFFAFNDYSYCNSDFVTAGWDQKVATFSNYSIPLFLSEFGCNKNLPRQFTEIQSLYSTNMSSVYSGGLVYEYSQEDSNFGLVEIDGNNVKELTDFNNLKNMYGGQQNPSGDGGFKATGSPSPCPPQSNTWNVTSGDALPAIPEPAKKFMTQGAGKPPGLSGDGSQNAGTGSTGTAAPGSGSATRTASTASSTSTKKSDAGSVRPPTFSMAPAAYVVMVFMSTLLGAALL